MISYRLVYHPKPLGPIIREIYALFMTDKETPVAAILFFFSKSNLISSTALQAQYLPHRGELSALINQNHFPKESQGAIKVNDPGLWVWPGGKKTKLGK